MFDEFIELINPFSPRPQEVSHEVDPVINELTTARVNEISQLVRSTLYADAAPVVPTIDFGRPSTMEAAVPAKPKQEFTPTTPQITDIPANQVPAAVATNDFHDMEARSREAYNAAYAEMPTTKPAISGDASELVGSANF